MSSILQSSTANTYGHSLVVIAIEEPPLATVDGLPIHWRWAVAGLLAAARCGSAVRVADECVRAGVQRLASCGWA